MKNNLTVMKKPVTDATKHKFSVSVLADVSLPEGVTIIEQPLPGADAEEGERVFIIEATVEQGFDIAGLPGVLAVEPF
jgi:hypothetical protein